MSPLGERARQQRWWLTVASYSVSSLVGGTFIGTALGGFGALLPLDASERLTGIAVFCVVAALLEYRRVPVSGPRRQVNQEWLARYRGWVYGTGFGFQLGLGFATIVSSWSLYAAGAGMLLAGWPFGSVVGAAFGLARVLPLMSVRGVQTTDDFEWLEPRLHNLADVAQAATTVALVALSVGAIAIVTLY